MLSNLSHSFKIASAGVLSLAAVGYAVFSLSPSADGTNFPVDYAHVAPKEPLSVEQFKAQVDRYSRNNMMVVLLRRNACGLCADVNAGLMEARSYLQKKTQRGFAVYELNAEQNPEVAVLLRQRDPQAEARIHVFYNGEKIFESAGISDNPRHIAESLEMVQALADGEVSAYDKYQPGNIFVVPQP